MPDAKHYHTAILPLALFLVILSLFIACTPKDTAISSKPLLVVSILPQIEQVQAIAGDAFEVQALVGSGQNPHTWEPSPRQIADLARAAVWFRIGIEFEDALAEKLKGLYPNLAIVDTTEGMEFRSLEAHDHEDDHEEEDHDAEHVEAEHDEHEHENGRDRHVWLGHKNASVALANIQSWLTTRWPEDAPDYAQRHADYLTKVDAVFDGLKSSLAPCVAARSSSTTRPSATSSTTWAWSRKPSSWAARNPAPKTWHG